MEGSLRALREFQQIRLSNEFKFNRQVRPTPLPPVPGAAHVASYLRTYSDKFWRPKECSRIECHGLTAAERLSITVLAQDSQ
jgi:hypothetical protein